jgi:hypothetical protein
MACYFSSLIIVLRNLVKKGDRVLQSKPLLKRDKHLKHFMIDFNSSIYTVAKLLKN